MKKPLLASRAGGMAEVVMNERTGLLLPPGGRAAWLEAVLRLVREPERVREWGENGRRWLDEEVSPRRWLEQFNRIAHRAGVFEREPVCAG
jgi:glycosyltransferase involved in cell wall biosynthesis